MSSGARLRAGQVEARVPVGGILGRLEGAALRLDQPTVSEAHALLSLRGGKLVLLALRGPLHLDGERLAEVPLRVGQRIGLGQALVEVLELFAPAPGEGVHRTAQAEIGWQAPLRVEVWREVSQLSTEDGRSLTLVGHPARILRELVLSGEPARWDELASTIWEDKEVDLRASWRRQLQVLRRKLRAVGLRADLVCSLGDGRAMLDLREGDVLVDRTFERGEGPG